jgi:sec-independent protein translocase protein TatB/colicin import membrane protein
MNILGIGPFELVIVMIIAFLLLGPEKMSDFSKELGRYLRKFNNKQDEFKDMIEKNINSIDDEDYSEKDDRK